MIFWVFMSFSLPYEFSSFHFSTAKLDRSVKLKWQLASKRTSRCLVLVIALKQGDQEMR